MSDKQAIRQLLVIGKGGTGKTTVVASFAALPGRPCWRIVMWMLLTCI